MTSKTFKFVDQDGFEIFVFNWLPKNLKKAKGVIQIAHGMGEHASRYERFAKALTAAGYIVFANDHRGHGRTAKNLDNFGYIGDKDAFNGMVRDMYHLNGIIHNKFPKLPVILFGHSMGSLLAQSFIETYKFRVNGVILSGASGPEGSVMNLGILIAILQGMIKGKKYRSVLLSKMVFGKYNKSFKPSRTLFDWLSRDKKEVDLYVADPYCGGIFPTSFFRFLFSGVQQIYRPGNLKKIPRDLPMYVFSGEKDPVGHNTKGVMKMLHLFSDLGIKDISYHFYKNARHEMLNETNRNEVMKNVITWLNKQV
jgi:alpha-beta hydrolase superfamily lysophospholipase